MRLLRKWLRASGVVALVLVHHTAAAEPSAAERETARAAFTEGDEAFDRGDYEAALRSYRAADAIMRAPPTAFAACEALVRLDRLVEARNTCIRAFQSSPREGEPASYPASREKAQTVAQQLLARIPTVRLVVPDTLAGSTLALRVDGETLPEAAIAAPLRLDPGEHQLSVTAPGFSPWDGSVTLKEGEEQSVEIALERLPEAPKPLPQPVTPDTEAGGSISPVAWIGFGLGAAGIAAGAVTGALALSASNDLDGRCAARIDGGCDRSSLDDPAGYQDDLDRTTLLAHVSTAGFAVGGAGIVLGLVGLLAFGDDSSEQEARVHIGPGSLLIQGSF